MNTFTVTHVGDDGDGLSYGPYDGKDAVEAVFEYKDDPNAGWFRADGVSTLRIEGSDGSSTQLFVDGRVVRDGAGETVGGWGSRPVE